MIRFILMTSLLTSSYCSFGSAGKPYPATEKQEGNEEVTNTSSLEAEASSDETVLGPSVEKSALLKIMERMFDRKFSKPPKEQQQLKETDYLREALRKKELEVESLRETLACITQNSSTEKFNRTLNGHPIYYCEKTKKYLFLVISNGVEDIKVKEWWISNSIRNIKKGFLWAKKQDGDTSLLPYAVEKVEFYNPFNSQWIDGEGISFNPGKTKSGKPYVALKATTSLKEEYPQSLNNILGNYTLLEL